MSYASATGEERRGDGMGTADGTAAASPKARNGPLWAYLSEGLISVVRETQLVFPTPGVTDAKSQPPRQAGWRRGARCPAVEAQGRAPVLALQTTRYRHISRNRMYLHRGTLESR
jgi:hypothetical protein